MAQIFTANQTFAAGETYGTGTTSSNALTLNKESGIITTESLSTAADASQVITITNNTVAANSRVRAGIQAYSGAFSTNGIPVLNVDDVAAGSFKLVVSNAHSANALSGTLAIQFEVLPPLV